jgi:hypothetical protein
MVGGVDHVECRWDRRRLRGSWGFWGSSVGEEVVHDGPNALHVNDVDVLALAVLAELADGQRVERQGAVGQRCGVVDEAREVEAVVHGDVLLGDLQKGA